MRARRLPSTRTSSTRSTSPPRIVGIDPLGQSRLAAGGPPHTFDDQALDVGGDGHRRRDFDLDHLGRLGDEALVLVGDVADERHATLSEQHAEHARGETVAVAA